MAVEGPPAAVQGRPRPEEARGTGYGLVRLYPACGRPEATIPAERPPFAARGDGRPLKLTDARRGRVPRAPCIANPDRDDNRKERGAACWSRVTQQVTVTR